MASAHPITANDAAAEIVALINSRAHSPRHDELEAIIAKVAAQPAATAEASATPSELGKVRAAIAELEAALDDGIEPCLRPDAANERITELADALQLLSEAVWARPVRTPADLEARAAIVRHHFRHLDCDIDGKLSQQHRWTDPATIDCPAEQSIAYLIEGVRDHLADVSGHVLTCADRGQLAQWDSIVRQHVADTKKACDDDAECDRLDNLLAATCEALWAQPVHSLDDVLVRVAVCVHWNSPLKRGDPAYPDYALAPAPGEGDMDSRSLAYLVRGLLALTGLCFDQDGRLLSGPEQNRCRD